MKKSIRWSLIVVLFGAMLCLAVVFLLASSVPEGYEPYRLTQEERELAAQHFATYHGIEFFNKARNVKPFVHEISADEFNQYLAALDEIAFLKPAKRGQTQRVGTVYDAMDKAGIADPVVEIDDEILTIMARTRGANKVISMDLKFQMVGDDRMKISLEGVRVGRMPVPRAVVDGGLEQLQQAIARREKLDEITHKDLDAMLGGVIAAIGQEPVSTILELDDDRIRRIQNIVLDDGMLKLYVEPVDVEQAEEIGPEPTELDMAPEEEPATPPDPAGGAVDEPASPSEETTDADAADATGTDTAPADESQDATGDEGSGVSTDESSAAN